jgi:mannobiose 2-epimerase
MIVDSTIQGWKNSLEIELNRILLFWKDLVIDKHTGACFGRVSNSNQVFPEAERGLVQQARVLWAFSATYGLNKAKEDKQIADKAYEYLIHTFEDKQHGGYFWIVNHQGNPLVTKKQLYGLAFALFGLAEYAAVTTEIQAQEKAITLFHTIENYFCDNSSGGYVEALSENWEPISDMRLSESDLNAPKSMNTHLHLLEAYSCLFKIWPDTQLKSKIEHLLQLFQNKIIDSASGILHLFFDSDWKVVSASVSPGHDVEAAWLLWEAALLLDNPILIKQIKTSSLGLLQSAVKGLDSDGALWEDTEKHWWPQAEAMVGFYTGWQFTQDPIWLGRSLNSWQFIQQKLVDKENGEWFWGIDADGRVLQKDKAGFWKCPYHNSRACIELIRRIEISNQA